MKVVTKLIPGARIDNSEITNINRGGAIDHGSTFSERAKEDVLRLVAPEIVTGQKYLNCHTGKRVVDLVPDIVDNKICSKVFFDAVIENEVTKVWGYDCG